MFFKDNKSYLTTTTKKTKKGRENAKSHHKTITKQCAISKPHLNTSKFIIRARKKENLYVNIYKVGRFSKKKTYFFLFSIRQLLRVYAYWKRKRKPFPKYEQHHFKSIIFLHLILPKSNWPSPNFFFMFHKYFCFVFFFLIYFCLAFS